MLWRVCFALGRSTDRPVDSNIAVKCAQDSVEDQLVHARRPQYQIVFLAGPFHIPGQNTQRAGHGFNRLVTVTGRRHVHGNRVLKRRFVASTKE